MILQRRGGRCGGVGLELRGEPLELGAAGGLPEEGVEAVDERGAVYADVDLHERVVRGGGGGGRRRRRRRGGGGRSSKGSEAAAERQRWWSPKMMMACCSQVPAAAREEPPPWRSGRAGRDVKDATADG